jgi:hypothetical protein
MPAAIKWFCGASEQKTEAIIIVAKGIRQELADFSILIALALRSSETRQSFDAKAALAIPAQAPRSK